MRTIENYENIQATSGEFDRIKPNGYLAVITKVVNFPLDEKTDKGDYLKIEFDIALGDYKGYYKKQSERFGSWQGKFIRSYKDSAAGMFKHFINCVEETNMGWTWTFDTIEKDLIGKFVGVVLGEEEYVKQDGTVGVSIVVKSIKTADDIKNGNFEIPKVKKLQQSSNPAPAIIQVEDEDCPF